MINYMTSLLLSKRTRQWSVEVGVVLTAVHLHLLIIVENQWKDANDTISKSKKDSPPRRPDRSGSNRLHLMIKNVDYLFYTFKIFYLIIQNLLVSTSNGFSGAQRSLNVGVLSLESLPRLKFLPKYCICQSAK